MGSTLLAVDIVFRKIGAVQTTSIEDLSKITKQICKTQPIFAKSALICRNFKQVL